MNNVVMIGRLTRDPEVKYTNNGEPMAIARYTLAVDRKYKRDGEQSADFIPCVAFSKSGEFVEKYLKKGMKIAVAGHLQSGQYKDKDGNTRYTLDLVADAHEFVESKASTQSSNVGDGFIDVQNGIEEELPF